jgi:capsular exopolysaccharide synthesis family protein
LSQTPHSEIASWINPIDEQVGLKRSVETIRERIWVIIGAIVVTTLIALVYVVTATKTYESTANILISPVSGSDPAINSLGLLRESSDPTRDIETAAQVIRNIEVANHAGSKLNPTESGEELLANVTAEPVANSNIVSVIGKATSAARAAEIANVFAQAAIDEQTATMHKEIENRLPPLEAQAGSEAEATGGGELSAAAQVAELKALASSPNPTLRLQTKATPPGGPSSPRKTLSLIAGILAGLILGVGGAFALQALDPRLRRESQLQRHYRLPILARVPRAGRRFGGEALTFGNVPPPISEAYRTLRATLTSSALSGINASGRVILVTGSSSSEGKTTSAVNLAIALARTNQRVILIEADIRRPSMGRMMGIESTGVGVVNVLAGNAPLEEGLVRPPAYEGDLRILLAEQAVVRGWTGDLFSTPRAEKLIAEARKTADFIVIDSPPINEVVDALPLAAVSDHVLLTAKLGRSRFDKLSELGELLAENGVTPTGFILIGTNPPKKSEYHYSASPAGRGSGAGSAAAKEPKGTSSPPPSKTTSSKPPKVKR